MTMPDNEQADFILSRGLVQHTPMLHFQHNETGVCLRGTEVKAKLDRFLLILLGRETGVVKDSDSYKQGNEIAKGKNWLTGTGEHPALNYKLRIFAPQKDPERTTTVENAIQAVKKGKKIKSKDAHKGICRSYFANMIDQHKSKEKQIREIKTKFKDTIFYEDGLELKIICFNKKLRDHIETHLELFFLLHNFGTRQSKGFGSFTVKPKIGESHQTDEEKLRNYYEKTGSSVWVLDYENERRTKHENGNEALKWIWIVYGFMKSGWNSGGNYFKGFALRYFYENSGEQYRNDKAFIKEQVLKDEYRSKEQAKGVEYRFIRAMLGISDQVTWERKGKGINWKNGKPTLKFECENDRIKRVPSPILFSVTSDRIFLLPQPIAPAVFGQEFIITSTQENEHKHCDQILTPTEKEFDFAAFLEAFANDLNLQPATSLTLRKL